MTRCNGNTCSKRKNDTNSVKEEHIQVVFKCIVRGQTVRRFIFY